jgi:hypothetical protein
VNTLQSIGTAVSLTYNAGGSITDTRYLMLAQCSYRPVSGTITALSVSDNMTGTGWTLHSSGILSAVDLSSNTWYSAFAWKVLTHADWLALGGGGIGNPVVSFTVTAGTATQYNFAIIIGDLWSVSAAGQAPIGPDIQAAHGYNHGVTAFSYTPASGSGRPLDADQLAYQAHTFLMNFGGGIYSVTPTFIGATMNLATNLNFGGDNYAQTVNLGGVTASATPATNTFAGTMFAGSNPNYLLAFGATFYYGPPADIQVMIV